LAVRPTFFCACGIRVRRCGGPLADVARFGHHDDVVASRDPPPEPHMTSACTLVQRQLDAYNAKDIDGWLATYATDAEQYTLHGERLARGHAELRERIAVRFAEPDLHARLLNRTVLGNIVVDLELITRNFPEGRGTVEMLCVYEVVDGLIQKASFAIGTPKLDAR